jgi:hypothetical protein
MKLESLRMERREWESGKPIKGELSFSENLGRITITLTEAQCHAVLLIVADSLVETSRAAATEMTANIIQAAALPQALESKS